MIKLRTIFYLKTLIFALGSLSTRLSFYISILAYVTFENSLTAEKAFVVIGAYNALRSVITISIPIGIAQIADAKTSVRRIKNVLLAEERSKAKRSRKSKSTSLDINGATVSIHGMKILNDINLHLDSGLIGLTGPVGNFSSCFFLRSSSCFLFIRISPPFIKSYNLYLIINR